MAFERIDKGRMENLIKPISSQADMKYMEALNYLNYRLLYIRPPCTLKYTTFTRARKRSLSRL